VGLPSCVALFVLLLLRCGKQQRRGLAFFFLQLNPLPFLMQMHRLKALYADHFGVQLRTLEGWPTGSHTLLAIAPLDDNDMFLT